VFRRLLLIAQCSSVLREDAIRLALREARRGADVQNFNDALAVAHQTPSFKDPEHLTDPSWAAEQEKKNNNDTHKLENELKGYKNNLIKESIRVSQAM
jgi:COP9 signalosome complex subunit 1